MHAYIQIPIQRPVVTSPCRPRSNQTNVKFGCGRGGGRCPGFPRAHPRALGGLGEKGAISEEEEEEE